MRDAPQPGSLWRHKMSGEVVSFVRVSQNEAGPGWVRYLLADVDALEPHEMAVAPARFESDYEPVSLAENGQAAPDHPFAVGDRWVKKSNPGWRLEIVRVESPEAFSVNYLHLPGTPPLYNADKAWLREYWTPEAEVPPLPPPLPIDIVPGASVTLTCGGPNVPHMTVERLSKVPLITPEGDTHISDEFYAHVLYVPAYGAEGRIIRDSFPLSTLRVVPPIPDPRAPDAPPQAR